MLPTPEKKVVVLCSGGMDSVTTLYAANEDYTVMASLSFHFGSKHNDSEIPFAKWHSEHLRVPHYTIDALLYELGFFPHTDIHEFERITRKRLGVRAMQKNWKLRGPQVEIVEKNIMYMLESIEGNSGHRLDRVVDLEIEDGQGSLLEGAE